MSHRDPAADTISPVVTWAAGLLTAALVLAPLLGARFSRAGITALEILVCGAAVLLALRNRNRDQAAVCPAGRWTSALLTCFLCWAILATASHHFRHESQMLSVDFACWLLAFWAAAAIAGRLKSGTAVICSGLAAGGSIAALRAIQEFIITRDPTWRAFGPFFNPGFLSGYLTLTIPVSLALYLNANGRLPVLLSAICSLIQISGILLSGTRYGVATGALAAAIFGGFVVFGRRERGDWRRLAAIGAAAVVVIAASSRPLVTRVGAAASEGHSGLFRLYTWRSTVRMAQDYPLFGVGPGRFEAAFARYAEAGFTRLAHQHYLQIAAETGIPGGALFVLAAAAGLWVCGKAAKSKDRPHEALLAAGLFAGALGSAARGLLDSDIYVFAITVSFWSALGAGSGAALRNDRFARAGSTAVLILAAVTACLALRLGTADLMAVIGDRAISNGDTLRAQRFYDRAARISSGNPQYQMRLGQIAETSGSAGRDEALRRFRRAVELDPGRARYHYVLGNAYSRYGNHRAALRQYKEASKYDPKAPRLILALARTYDALGSPSKAMAEYRRLVQQESTPYEKIRAIPQVVETSYAFAHYEIAEDLLKRNRKREAIRQYELCAARLERWASFGRYLAALQEAQAITYEDLVSLDALYGKAAGRLEQLYRAEGRDRLARDWAEKKKAGLFGSGQAENGSGDSR